MLLMLSLLLIAGFNAVICYLKNGLRQRRSLYRRQGLSSSAVRVQRKPEWVSREVIRLKAHLPDYGCRKLAHTFNRSFAARGITVSKSYVADVVRRHASEICALRATWKNHIPPPLPANHTWGLDATGKSDQSGQLHSILGIIDHGTQRAICMMPLRDLSTITILRTLLNTTELFGKPRFLRTDNESQFHSLLFRSCMRILGIRIRYSLPGMPWMNGRIERLFGTLKGRLNRLTVTDFDALEFAMNEFKIWYNQIRPHQHL